MSIGVPLAALPGSSGDPGTGPAVAELFDLLLDDASLTVQDGQGAQDGQQARDARVAHLLATHRAHRTAWYADLVGPLVVPASLAESVQAALSPSDHALRIVLASEPRSEPAPEAARQRVRAARDLLAEDDRVEIVGVRLGLPAGGGALATRRLLETLDFSVPAWIEVHSDGDWADALAVLADDGAEHLALPLDDASTASTTALADVLRRAVDVDLTFRIAGRGLDAVRADRSHGWLNALGAVRAALNGAGAPDVAAVLAVRESAPLASGLRRMSVADAAVTRAFLAAVECPDIAAAIERLTDLGLIGPQT